MLNRKIKYVQVISLKIKIKNINKIREMGEKYTIRSVDFSRWLKSHGAWLGSHPTTLITQAAFPLLSYLNHHPCTRKELGRNERH